MRSCFNSIVVRLKEIDFNALLNAYQGFNSIVVRLKEEYIVPATLNHTCFNSIVVRLKVNKKNFARHLIAGFNSIVVRLKGDAINALACSFWYVSIP